MKDESISDSAFARRKRALNSLINDLRAIGIDQEVTLPSIVVIGNQSAGKSSVVEAISGINVPRDSGTCTRCPFEVRLQQHDGPWSCNFKLRFHNVGGKASVEKSFGPSLDETTKGQVENRLRRAQLAILEGDLNGCEQFLTCQLEQQQTPQRFSSDVVVVEIKGPEVVDLTFIDLPGIMQGKDREEVESLTRKHIEGECVILMTVNTSDDIDNQRAHHLTRQIDPNGDRTIGVLTKPDMIEPGTESRWINTLQGGNGTVTGETRYGYYCVRRPSAKERDAQITSTIAEQTEMKFFDGPSWSRHRNTVGGRLGMRHLITALSNVLCSRIEEKLPELRAAIFGGLLEVKKSIRDLPDPPSSDPSVQMFQLCASLQNRLEKLVDSPQGSPLLRKTKQKVFDVLAERLNGAIPQFSHLPSPIVTPERYFEDSGPTSPPSAMPMLVRACTPGSEPELVTFESDGYIRPTIYLQEVRHIKEKSLACELPFTLPYAAKLDLIKAPMEKWSEAVQDAFGKAAPILRDLVNDEITHLFEPYAGAHLRITQSVAEYLEERAPVIEEKLTKYVSMDETPFTINIAQYRVSRDAQFDELQELRNAPKLKAYAADRHTRDNPGHWRFDFDQEVSNALAGLARLGLEGLKEKDLWKLLPRDEWEEELSLCAAAKAYWDVACQRLIDDIPRLIVHEYFRPLPHALQELILSMVGIGTPLCHELLAEDPKLASTRQQLESKKKRFEEALRRFERFERGEQ